MTRLALAAIVALAAATPASAAHRLTPHEAKRLLVHQLEHDGYRPSSTRRIYCIPDQGPRGIQCDVRFYDLAARRTYCGLASILTTGPRYWAWNLTATGCTWW